MPAMFAKGVLLSRRFLNYVMEDPLFLFFMATRTHTQKIPGGKSGLVLISSGYSAPESRLVGASWELAYGEDV